MSWRGTKGAVEAAKQHHNVILTPGSHCYFDHYQSENENEPLAIGGFTPLEKVYHFNPIPEELTKDESNYVLGAQGNVWTEYMSTPSQVEYMVFPRIMALSEVVWSSEKNKDYGDFIDRLEYFLKILDVKNVNYANHLYDVKGKLSNENGNLFYELKTATKGKKIFYTTDNSLPSTSSKLYTKKIQIDASTTIKAVVFDSNQKQLGSVFEKKINFHKALGKKISLNVAPHKAYNTGGKEALINGVSGNNKRYGDKEWLGFSGEDLEISIEFDNPTDINKISTRFYDGNGQWIYAPKEVILLIDDDSTKYRFDIEKSNKLLINCTLNVDSKNVRFLKLIIPSYGIIPEGKQGAGHKAWTFIDEIIVE